MLPIFMLVNSYCIEMCVILLHLRHLISYPSNCYLWQRRSPQIGCSCKGGGDYRFLWLKVKGAARAVHTSTEIHKICDALLFEIVSITRKPQGTSTTHST